MGEPVISRKLAGQLAIQRCRVALAVADYFLQTSFDDSAALLVRQRLLHGQFCACTFKLPLSALQQLDQRCNVGVVLAHASVRLGNRFIDQARACQLKSLKCLGIQTLPGRVVRPSFCIPHQGIGKRDQLLAADHFCRLRQCLGYFKNVPIRDDR